MTQVFHPIIRVLCPHSISGRVSSCIPPWKLGKSSLGVQYTLTRDLVFCHKTLIVHNRADFPNFRQKPCPILFYNAVFYHFDPMIVIFCLLGSQNFYSWTFKVKHFFYN